MRINLGGRNVHMTKHHLHGTEIRPPLQEMARKGVTKEVRGDPFSKAGSSRIIFEALPESLPAHPLPRAVDKKRWALFPLR